MAVKIQPWAASEPKLNIAQASFSLPFGLGSFSTSPPQVLTRYWTCVFWHMWWCKLWVSLRGLIRFVLITILSLESNKVACSNNISMGFLGVSVVANSSANAGDAGKIPWMRAWQCTPVFLPEKSHDRANCQATFHGVTKNWTQLSMHVLPVHTHTNTSKHNISILWYFSKDGNKASWERGVFSNLLTGQ